MRCSTPHHRGRWSSQRCCGLASLFGNDYYLRIVFMMCVYYLCAAGMNVLVGYAGQKSLGQAGLFAAGAYAVALLTTQHRSESLAGARRCRGRRRRRAAC